MKLEEYNSLQYPITIQPEEEGGYVVTYPDLPGVITHGDTREQAVEFGEIARRRWTKIRLEKGLVVPLPGEFGTCSGNFMVRLPKSLHRKLKWRAKAEDISMNQLVVAIIAEAVGRYSTES